MKWTKASVYPFIPDHYWIYTSEKEVKLTHFDGKKFEVGDYKDEITHWMPLQYPRPPLDERPR